MVKNNNQSLIFQLFGLLMVVMEFLVYFSKEDFNNIKDVGWMIHGSLMLIFLGMMVIFFTLAGLVKKK